MNKGNVIRAIFWGIIGLILLSMAIIGLFNSNKIFDNYKGKLESIVYVFNNHTTIKNYKKVNTNIEASLDGKNIRVTYDGAYDKEYVYKLHNGYIETSFANDDNVASMILMVLADSISVTSGQKEGATFPLFTNKAVQLYKLSEGILYETKGYKYLVKLNINDDEFIKVILDEEIESEI